MGLSSNARLLSLTARITSNEYEAQKISNAKMRLAIQSQQASEDYIKALNSRKMVLTGYNSDGTEMNYDLTPNLLYQFGDGKNQYMLANIHGQALVGIEDSEIFQSCDNLDEFLAHYGITKNWKTDALTKSANLLNSQEYQKYVDDWQDCLNEIMYKTTSWKYKKNTYTYDSNNEYVINTSYESYTNEDSELAFEHERSLKEQSYLATNAEYVNAYNDLLSRDEKTDYLKNKVSGAYENMLAEKRDYTENYLTYDSWVQMKAKELNKSAYENYQKYLTEAASFNAEVEQMNGIDNCFEYSDATKARWYTNLWYRLNGESSEKSTAGRNAQNYQILDKNLSGSSSWVQDALAHGTITIEKAQYQKTSDEIPDENNPTVLNLKGISWISKISSACSDLQEVDDEQAAVKAQAEYESKTAEIANKDQKYQLKLKNLETEHTSMLQQYESIQSALSADIKRSFNGFNI